MRLGLGLIVGLWAACSADVDPDTCAVDRPEGSCPSGATCEAGRCRVDPGDAVGDALADWTAFREWAEPRDLLVDRHPVSWSDVDAWVTPRIDAYRWRPRLVDAWSIFREAWRETEAKHLGEDAASVALASAILRTWADEVVEAGAVPVVVLADVSGRPPPPTATTAVGSVYASVCAQAGTVCIEAQPGQTAAVAGGGSFYSPRGHWSAEMNEAIAVVTAEGLRPVLPKP